MDCSPPGSSIHGILQARILEWVAISFSRGSSQCKNQTRVSHIASRGFLTSEPPGKPKRHSLISDLDLALCHTASNLGKNSLSCTLVKTFKLINIKFLVSFSKMVMKTKCEMFVILFHEKIGNTIAFREGKKQDSYVKDFFVLL